MGFAIAGASSRKLEALNPSYGLCYAVLLRGLAEAVVERIAGAADRADRIDLVAAVERLAQAADMDVDGALVDVDLAAPDAVEQLLPREHPSRPLHQEFQQPVFGRAEIDGAAAARHSLLLAIDLEVAEAEHVGEPLGKRPAQQRAHARAQLGHRERLDDVIIGAGGEAAYALALLAARGQHDDGQLLGLGAGPQPAAELDPGEPRQHPVEDHEIGGTLLEQQIRLITARDRLDLVSFRFEVVAQQQRERLLVFHNQDVGLHPLNLSAISPPPSMRTWSCRPWDADQRSGAPRPCSRPSRRCWWRGPPSARCSLRRTSDGCRT